MNDHEPQQPGVLDRVLDIRLLAILAVVIPVTIWWCFPSVDVQATASSSPLGPWRDAPPPSPSAAFPVFSDTPPPPRVERRAPGRVTTDLLQALREGPSSELVRVATPQARELLEKWAEAIAEAEEAGEKTVILARGDDRYGNRTYRVSVGEGRKLGEIEVQRHEGRWTIVAANR